MTIHLVDPRLGQRAQAPAIGGLVVGTAFAGMLVVFIGGEMLSDPGGWAGLAFVAAWLIPTALATALALWRPAIASVVMVIVVAGLLLTAGLALLDPVAAWQFEDTHGPVMLMATIAVCIPLVALGRARPAAAAALLYAATVGSLVLQGISVLIAGQPTVILVLVVLMTPFIGVATLYAVAAATRRQRRRGSPAGDAGTPAGS